MSKRLKITLTIVISAISILLVYVTVQTFYLYQKSHKTDVILLQRSVLNLKHAMNSLEHVENTWDQQNLTNSNSLYYVELPSQINVTREMLALYYQRKDFYAPQKFVLPLLDLYSNDIKNNIALFNSENLSSKHTKEHITQIRRDITLLMDFINNEIETEEQFTKDWIEVCRKLQYQSVAEQYFQTMEVIHGIK